MLKPDIAAYSVPILLAPVQGLRVSKPKNLGDGRQGERVIAIPCSQGRRRVLNFRGSVNILKIVG